MVRKHLFVFFLFCIAGVNAKGQLSLKEWTEAFFKVSLFPEGHYEVKGDTVFLIFPTPYSSKTAGVELTTKKYTELVCNLLDSGQKAVLIYECSDTTIKNILHCNYRTAKYAEERFNILRDGIYGGMNFKYNGSSVLCNLYAIGFNKEEMDQYSSALWRLLRWWAFRCPIQLTFALFDCYKDQQTYLRNF